MTKEVLPGGKNMRIRVAQPSNALDHVIANIDRLKVFIATKNRPDKGLGGFGWRCDSS
jgi:hypothetical protein